jgi:hypothetical protein
LIVVLVAYIFLVILFDEAVFPFATPGIVINFTTLLPVHFPTQEPTTQGPILRTYDMILLPVNPPDALSLLVQVSVTSPDAPDAQGVIDMPVLPMHASLPVPALPRAAPTSPHQPSSLGGPVSPADGPASSRARSLSPAHDASPPPPDAPASVDVAPMDGAPPLVKSHSMVTCRYNNVSQPKIYTDGTARYDPYRQHAFLVVLGSHRTALSELDWRSAMLDEFDSLQRNQTWRLVPKPPGVNIVGSKWIFKTKFWPDGSVDKHKARLVARVNIVGSKWIFKIKFQKSESKKLQHFQKIHEPFFKNQKEVEEAISHACVIRG